MTRLCFGKHRRVVNIIILNFTPLSEPAIPAGVELPASHQYFSDPFTISFPKDFWDLEQQNEVREAGKAMGWDISVINSLRLEPRGGNTVYILDSAERPTNSVKITVWCEAISFLGTFVRVFQCGKHGDLPDFLNVVFDVDTNRSVSPALGEINEEELQDAEVDRQLRVCSLKPDLEKELSNIESSDAMDRDGGKQGANGDNGAFGGENGVVRDDDEGLRGVKSAVFDLTEDQGQAEKN
jgi:hypothetical protein